MDNINSLDGIITELKEANQTFTTAAVSMNKVGDGFDDFRDTFDRMAGQLSNLRLASQNSEKVAKENVDSITETKLNTFFTDLFKFYEVFAAQDLKTNFILEEINIGVASLVSMKRQELVEKGFRALSDEETADEATQKIARMKQSPSAANNLQQKDNSMFTPGLMFGGGILASIMALPGLLLRGVTSVVMGILGVFKIIGGLFSASSMSGVFAVLRTFGGFLLKFIAIGAIIYSLYKLVTAIMESEELGPMIERVKEVWTTKIVPTFEKLKDSVIRIGEALEIAKDKFLNEISWMYEWMDIDWASIGEKVKEFFDDPWPVLADAVIVAGERLINLLAVQFEGLSKVVSGIASLTEGKWQEGFKEIFLGIGETVINSVRAVFGLESIDLGEYFASAKTNLKNLFKDMANGLSDSIDNASKDLSNWILDGAFNMGAKILGVADKIKLFVSQPGRFIDYITESMSSALNDAKSSIKAEFGNVMKISSEFIKGILRWILPIPDWNEPLSVKTIVGMALPNSIYEYAGINKETGERIGGGIWNQIDQSLGTSPGGGNIIVQSGYTATGPIIQKTPVAAASTAATGPISPSTVAAAITPATGPIIQKTPVAAAITPATGSSVASGALLDDSMKRFMEANAKLNGGGSGKGIVVDGSITNVNNDNSSINHIPSTAVSPMNDFLNLYQRDIVFNSGR